MAAPKNGITLSEAFEAATVRLEKGQFIISVPRGVPEPSKSGKMELHASSGGFKQVGDYSLNLILGRKRG